ncbi:hypothetical protein Ait01nite_012930 [Actinoplanes italicus]|uniref:Uncharacterized protein n=1 Tax=Actinoplanes italicus TaxID=113567 RepID=A0A2T0KH13_9ACTN|nr:hypothetical protein [Actinoplanes italicus]PRX22726.1 hypothetical protein CLV67_104254 [Actinoplanes italicus]GIE28248.1 hypothetical protein Ait01nite_012930 [Actinoplanes italicus]
MGGNGAVAMFVGLVDHSVERIREIAADPRRFDRQEVARIADVWDNNTSHFFAVLQARPWRRDLLARRALRWMAAFGSQRRAWMIRQGGEPMLRLLGPARPEELFYRDYQGHVRASPLPLELSGLAVDYDLPRATATLVRVERAGAGFDGIVMLRVPRRYADGDCTVQLRLSGVRQARVDSGDVTGADVGAGPAGIEVRVGSAGTLVAGSVEVWPYDDGLWHLSRTGRAADAITAPWVKARRRLPVPGPAGAPKAAAFAFHQSMIQIRRVRSETAVARVRILERCAVLADAGTRAVAAARTRTFADLGEQWSSELPDLDGPADRIPAGAVLSLAACSPDSTTVNVAEPVEGRWRLGAARLPGPGRIVLADDRLSLDGEGDSESP